MLTIMKDRVGSLMVSALNSGSNDLGRAQTVDCVAFLGEMLYSYSGFTNQVHTCKWVPTKLMRGVTVTRQASNPRGSRNTPSHFMVQKTEISAGLMGY